MACNRETSAADGTSRAPPAPATPGSCPSPDAPSCDNNCRLSGRAATMGLCPQCYRELLLKDESAFKVSKQKEVDSAEPAVVSGQLTVGISDVTARGSSPAEQGDDQSDLVGMVGTSDMADISDLRVVMKSKSSLARRKSLVVPWTQSSGPCSSYQEERILSPLFLSPPLHQGDLSSSAPPRQERSMNRCATCRKRVGLLGFKCRCGDLFCASHRYSDKHDCSFDYKAAGRLAIAKENPLVVASKINKI